MMQGQGQQGSEKAPRERPPSQLAFVAGGGAIKAYAYHCGVLRGLRDDGFRFRGGTRWEPVLAPPGAREIDTYVGSSAGACIAASLASGHDIDEMRNAILGKARTVPRFGYRVMYAPIAPHPGRYLWRLWRRYMLGLLRPHHVLDVGGLVTAAGMERYFRKHVLPTNRFQDLEPALYLVATQVNGFRKVVFGNTDSLGDDGYGRECAWYDNVEISEALAAAVSLPPLFAPYGIVNAATGKMFHYHDGEVREPLSLHVARDVGARFAIASSIWRPYAWQDRVGSLADFGMMTLAEQAIHQAIEQKVVRDLARAEEVEHALAILDEYGNRHGIAPASLQELKQQVCQALGHRRMRVLHVCPEPSDAEFFFEGSFRFHPGIIERCVDAGHRAYLYASRTDPDFFALLDEVLGSSSGNGAKVIDWQAARARAGGS